MSKRRKFTEIREAEDTLREQVWYNRHQGLVYDIEAGVVKVVEDADWRLKDHSHTCTRSIWEAAQAAARRVEEQIGLDELGPWDDFEWGMLNGKMSALRWVMGEEWDFLDT
jgi:hypothetical protein